MTPIEIERWEPDPDDPRYIQSAGSRTGEEVFAELKQRLEGLGYLPDEYFLLDKRWENGREIPRSADVFCTTDYGESEGVYLDIYLKWRKDGKTHTENFITGKTLGNKGSDLDRMFLIASAVTKAFHGDRGTYPRYTEMGGVEKPQDMVLHLNPSEQQVFIDALLRQREKSYDSIERTEMLLRRMTGSITGYMDLVGARPLRISEFDRTMLAIRDGELDTFLKLYPQQTEHMDELLVAAAGRAGTIGTKMTLNLLAIQTQYQQESYLAACKGAVDTGDTDRVQLLLGQAKESVAELQPTFYGKVIQYASYEKPAMARALIEDSPAEWIAAAPPQLLYSAVTRDDYHSQMTLLEKGIDADACAADVFHYLCCGHKEHDTAFLLDQGMKVDPHNYPALHSCVRNGGLETAKKLLDLGMDFEGYKPWLERTKRATNGHDDLVEALAEHWAGLQQEAAGQEQEMGGMAQ